MAHTAEDLCEIFLPGDDGCRCKHSDVKHGFVLSFDEPKPELDLDELESKVLDAIAKDLTISYVDEGHIMIGDLLHHGSENACAEYGMRTKFSYRETYIL